MNGKIWEKEREALDGISSMVDTLIAGLPDDIDGRCVRRLMAKVATNLSAADWILEHAQDMDSTENSADMAHEQAREAGL